jgi:hypothetical protein
MPVATEVASRVPASACQPDSWCVRYDTLRELQDLLQARFDRYDYRAQAYFGAG